MTPPKYFWLVFLAVVATASLSPAEITGKVRDASGDSATVVLDGDAPAAIGDSAEIFFKVPGADEEISVASGKVAAVEAKVVQIKIEKSTGTIAKDQLARIKSGSTPQAPGASPTVPSSPSGTAASTSPSIVGNWVGTFGNGDKYSFTFSADQTVTWTIEAKTESSGAKPRATVQAKYRLDNTTKPNRIDIFDSDSPELIPKGETLHGLFEFQGDSQLKMDLSVGASEHPEKGFTDAATIFSRVTSPIVAPPEKTPAASPSPPSSPSTPAPTSSSIVGDWVGNLPGAGGPKMSFSFKEDGTLLWVIEGPEYGMSMPAKYRIDPSTQPQSIELFDFEADAFKGQNERGIFELQSDGRLKLDFAPQKGPPLKEFTESALILSKATSPVVRSTKPPPPTPTPSVAPTPATGSSIIGDWVGSLPGGVTKMSFSFKEDGTLLWVTEDEKYAQSTLAKYRIDPSTKLQSIELFDFEEGSDMSGERLRGIFELQSDGRLKLDFQNDPKAPPLKEFRKEALVFSKATSPIVRSNKPAPPPPPPPSPDEKLIEEGNDLSKRKDYDGAIKAYTKAIEVNPKNARAFYLRGMALFEKKDRTAALADVEKATELDPSMKLEELIAAMRAAKNFADEQKASASPTPSKLAPSPTRKKSKPKP